MSHGGSIMTTSNLPNTSKSRYLRSQSSHCGGNNYTPAPISCSLDRLRGESPRREDPKRDLWTCRPTRRAVSPCSALSPPEDLPAPSGGTCTYLVDGTLGRGQDTGSARSKGRGGMWRTVEVTTVTERRIRMWSDVLHEMHLPRTIRSSVLVFEYTRTMGQTLGHDFPPPSPDLAEHVLRVVCWHKSTNASSGTNRSLACVSVPSSAAWERRRKGERVRSGGRDGLATFDAESESESTSKALGLEDSTQLDSGALQSQPWLWVAAEAAGRGVVRPRFAEEDGKRRDGLMKLEGRARTLRASRLATKVIHCPARWGDNRQLSDVTGARMHTHGDKGWRRRCAMLMQTDKQVQSL